MTEERSAQNLVTSENLAEFASKKLGLAEKTPAQSPEPVPSEPEQNEQQEETPKEEGKKNKLERRFSDLTKQREQARQEAAEERRKREELEARLRDLEVKSAPVPAPDVDAKPRPDQFADAFEYAEKLAEWTTNQALKNREKQEAERKAAEAREATVKEWQKRLQSAKAELPDFDDMVTSSDVAVNDLIRDAIVESDVGPYILYHLAENPEIATKLNGMSPTAALREIGRMETRFEKKAAAPAPRPKASEPINPIRSVAAGVDTGLDASGEFRGSFSDYRALRRAGKIR